MKACAVTDVGRERSINQDFVFYSLEPVGSLPNLFLVADGMGGHKAGDMASRYTTETLVSLIRESEFHDPVTVINDAILKVNERLLKKAEESEDYEGMGTTLVVATITEDVLQVANVGDSRLYLIDEAIHQITRDHSLVEEMVSMGEIDRNQAKHHVNKNIITRAIGGSDTVEPEMFAIDLKAQDRILLCSDGLTNMVDDQEILQIVRQNREAAEAAQQLVDTANEHGGTDNITALIIEP